MNRIPNRGRAPRAIQSDLHRPLTTKPLFWG